MTDADIELERHIRDCGRLLIKAYNEGNAEDAAKWLALQTEAINGRSPEHVALLERERGMV